MKKSFTFELRDRFTNEPVSFDYLNDKYFKPSIWHPYERYKICSVCVSDDGSVWLEDAYEHQYYLDKEDDERFFITITIK